MSLITSASSCQVAATLQMQSLALDISVSKLHLCLQSAAVCWQGPDSQASLAPALHLQLPAGHLHVVAGSLVLTHTLAHPCCPGALLSPGGALLPCACHTCFSISHHPNPYSRLPIAFAHHASLHRHGPVCSEVVLKEVNCGCQGPEFKSWLWVGSVG